MTRLSRTQVVLIVVVMMFAAILIASFAAQQERDHGAADQRGATNGKAALDAVLK